MQESYPHNIRRFSDGEGVPGGWFGLTEEEFRLLDPMNPKERARWLRGRQTEAMQPPADPRGNRKERRRAAHRIRRRLAEAKRQEKR